MLAAQRERDARDESREHSALRAADDAVEIDTTGLALDEVVDRIVALARRAGPGRDEPARPSPSSASPTSARAPWSTGSPAGARRSPTPSPASPATASGCAASGTGVAFELLDTGGIDLEDESELARDIQRQARLGIAEADVVLLVVDARAGVRAGDAELAKTLRGADGAGRSSSPTRSTGPRTST